MNILYTSNAIIFWLFYSFHINDLDFKYEKSTVTIRKFISSTLLYIMNKVLFGRTN